MRSAQFLSSALLFTYATAWQWQDSWSNDVLDVAGLVKRQDGSAATSDTNTFAEVTLGDTAAATPNPTDDTSSTPTTQASAAKTTAAASSGDQSSPSSAGSGTSSGNTKATSSGGTSSDDGKGSKTTSSPKTTVVDPRLPAGGVSMITPNALSAASYYKIGNYVTFAWNYTSLSVTPTAIDILATCTANQATYTLALNQSVQQTQAITWDTGAYQSTATIPLLTEKYTLIIHDAAKGVSATAQAGYLGTYQQFTFGMYTPQAYTPLDEYVCATCSGAMSVMERQTWGFLAGMVGITILSFTWFAGGAGLFAL